jgi:hypothetical protein
MIEEGEASAECSGNSAEPKAQAGFLCIYLRGEPDGFLGGTVGVFDMTVSGAWIGSVFEEKGIATGTFAVTAP